MTRLVTDTGPLLAVPAWLLDAPGVGCRELQLYLVLCRHADRETGEAWPSRRRLAEQCGVASARTIDAALGRLVAVGALAIERRRDAAGDLTTSVYTVLRARPGVVQRAARPRAADRTTGRATSCAVNVVPEGTGGTSPCSPPPRRRVRDRFVDLPSYDDRTGGAR